MRREHDSGLPEVRSIEYHAAMKMTQLRRKGLPVLMLLLCAFVWFTGIETLLPHYFLWDDNATFFLPLYLFNYEAVASEHILPIINFYQFAGWNHLHAGQSGVLYAPAYLAAWIATVILRSALLTMDILAIGHLTLGMLGMYAWLRLLGAKRTFAMGGAVFYLTLPFSTILSRSWIFVSYTHCYAPWCFFFLESNLQKNRLPVSIGYILTKTLFFLQGYPQYVVYFSCFELLYIYLLHRKSANRRNPWLQYLLWNLWVCILSLPLLLPMIESTLLSAQRSTPLSIASILKFSLLLSDFLKDQFVFFLKHKNYYFLTDTYLLGSSIFIPWVVYKVIHSRKKIPVPTINLLMMCSIALLMSTWFYALFTWIPILDRFRWPFKIFYFCGLFFTASFTLLLQWAFAHHVFSKAMILYIGIFAVLSHAIVIPTPPIGTQTLTIEHSPLATYADSSFRMIAVSTIDGFPSSLCDRFPVFNYPSIWRIPALSGYDPLASRLHTDIRTPFTDRTGFYDPKTFFMAMDRFSGWSVRYVITREALAPEIVKHTSLQKIASGSSIIAYENPNAYPIAAFEKTPKIPIPLEYKVNRIRLKTDNQTGNVLLRMAPIAGYSLVLPNGTLQPAQQTDTGVVVSIEDSQIFTDVIYRSKTFEWGLFGTLLGLVTGFAIFIGMGLRNVMKRKKAKA